jgi:MoaA/NifB/PqqE/SkfB family radical SAM enzyme
MPGTVPRPVEEDAAVRLREAVEQGAFCGLDEVKIKLVDACNLRCVKCGHWRASRRASPDRTRPLSQAQWLDAASQMIALGARKVKISGGEPALHPALVPLTARLAAGGVRCSLTTNGTLLAGPLGRDLVEAGLERVRFSVDGPEAGIHDGIVGMPGAFERLGAGLASVQAAARAAGRRVRCTLNTVVCQENVSRLSDLVGWAAGQGVRQMALVRIHTAHLPAGTRQRLGLTVGGLARYEQETLPRLIAQGRAAGIEVSPTGYQVTEAGGVEEIPARGLKDVPCFNAFTGAAVYPAGDVYVCCHVRDKRLRFGNLRAERLGEVLGGEKGGRVRAVCRAPGREIAACLTCDVNIADRLLQARHLGFLS